MTQHQRQRRLDVDEFLGVGRRPAGGTLRACRRRGGRHGAGGRIAHALSQARRRAVALKADGFGGGASVARRSLRRRGGADHDDRNNMYIPDVIVRCEARKGYERTVGKWMNPVILVEIVSPSTQSIDSVAEGCSRYFQLPSLRHYLIVAPEARAVGPPSSAPTTGEIESRLVAARHARARPAGPHGRGRGVFRLALEVPALLHHEFRVERAAALIDFRMSIMSRAETPERVEAGDHLGQRYRIVDDGEAVARILMISALVRGITRSGRRRRGWAAPRAAAPRPAASGCPGSPPPG